MSIAARGFFSLLNSMHMSTSISQHSPALMRLSSGLLRDVLPQTSVQAISHIYIPRRCVQSQRTLSSCGTRSGYLCTNGTHSSRIYPSFHTSVAVKYSSKVKQNPAQDAVVDKAKITDVPQIERIVRAAYSMYIERLGKEPAPMEANYHEAAATDNLYVLRHGGNVVGYIILSIGSRSVMIDNVAVDPSAQGRGYGRILLAHAEAVAVAEGRDAVTLYTNEKMYENLALYLKAGYEETGRKTEDGYNRVYFRKVIGASRG